MFLKFTLIFLCGHWISVLGSLGCYSTPLWPRVVPAPRSAQICLQTDPPQRWSPCDVLSNEVGCVGGPVWSGLGQSGS